MSNVVALHHVEFMQSTPRITDGKKSYIGLIIVNGAPMPADSGFIAKEYTVNGDIYIQTVDHLLVKIG